MNLRHRLLQIDTDQRIKSLHHVSYCYMWSPSVIQAFNRTAIPLDMNLMRIDGAR